MKWNMMIVFGLTNNYKHDAELTRVYRGFSMRHHP
jgi:hypothetical protein